MTGPETPDPKPSSRREIPAPEVPNEFTQTYLMVCERQKTIRIGILCLAGCVFAWIIADAIIKLLAKEKNIWIALLPYLLGPGGILVTLLKMWHRYVRINNKRTKELELKVDPKRTSSGLEEDGRSKYGL